MKRNYIILILLILSCNLLADNVKDILGRVPLSQLPFACIKHAPYPRPAMGYPIDMNTYFPRDTYNDLGLTQKNIDPNTGCVVFRKFKPQKGNYDLVALDLSISEWGKKILVTYHDGEFVDYIEVEVSWCYDELICIKQWQINANEEIIVTWLKVESSTPVSGFSNFNNVQAQRIDIHYEIDTNGKFQEIKQVKYQPQNYKQSYLEDRTKNLWEGNEIPIE